MLSIYTILGAVHIGAPAVILTLITKNLKLVSVYTIFNMVIAGINGILSIFISGLSASFGDVIAKGETTVLQKAYREVVEFAYYGLITLVYSIAFVTIMPFIKIYTKGVTDINYDVPLIGFLFVLNGLLYNIKTPQGMLVISAGLFKETKVQTTIQGVTCCCCRDNSGPILWNRRCVNWFYTIYTYIETLICSFLFLEMLLNCPLKVLHCA